MDAYCYALSTIKKLGYICDTLLYLTDFQPQLFLRRLSKLRRPTIIIGNKIRVAQRVTRILHFKEFRGKMNLIHKLLVFCSLIRNFAALRINKVE